MKVKLAKISAFLLLLSLCSISAFSQNLNQVRNQYMGELSKTDRVIEQARSIIRENNAAYDSELLRIATRQAERLLEEAVDYQTRASAFQGNSSTLAEIKSGMKFTIQARELAMKAIMVKRSAEGKIEENENTVRNQLEKVDRQIERLKENFQSEISNQLRTAFDSIIENQKRAWELFRSRNLRAALKMSHNAERAIKKIAERLKENNRQNQRIQGRYNNLIQKAEWAKQIIAGCNSDEAAKIMDQVENALNDTGGYIENQQTKRAEKTMNNIRRMIQKISDLCSDNSALEGALAKLKQSYERYSGEILHSGNREAIRLLESTKTNLNKAERFCSAGESEKCAAAVKAAQISLRKAIRVAGL
jgi:hypothetical protein